MPKPFNPEVFLRALGTTAALILVGGFILWIIVGMPRLFPAHDHSQDEKLIEDTLQKYYKGKRT